jgi:hypothetical protein
MKTQERLLKQCISGLFIIGLIFWPKTPVFAYSSLAPWQNEAGPEHGLVFTPAAGYESNDNGTSNNSAEFNLDLNAAINSELSAFGRYSVQTDQRLGLSEKVFHNHDLEVHAQVEATYSPDEVVGFTGGLFARVPLRFLGLPTFTAELGIGVSNNPSTQTAFVPASFLILHNPETSGFYYGTGFKGESATDTTDGYVSFRAIGGYQNVNGIRYGLEAGLPATAITPDNVTSICFQLVIPFGTGTAHSDPTPSKAVPELSADPHPEYDLDAKITSMNEAMYLVKIDKGSNDSIVKGQTFDIYSGQNRMARAQVIAVKNDEAALNVIEYNQEYWIELGFSARRVSRGTE